jgi:hypothetical protein
MPGSRVRVPPLLYVSQPLGRSRSSGFSHSARRQPDGAPQLLAEFRTARALSGDEALAAMDTDLWSFREWDAHALGSREAEDSPFS